MTKLILIFKNHSSVDADCTFWYFSQVMPEVVNSVGNVVMRQFKHYITENIHRWLKEDRSLEEEEETD